VSLSIEGMTCAACSSAITELVSELPDVSDLTVNLLSNSASMIVQRKELVDTVLVVIEDAGFRAAVITVAPTRKKVEPSNQSRTISLRVERIPKSCSEKIMAVLEQYQATIEIASTDGQDAILRITYSPSPPSFTIRTIIDALSRSQSPPLKVSVYKPPSIEERSRAIQKRERRHLLYRFIFSLVIAIPTFVIGIVFMSLAPNGNLTKDFFMEPMWTGNTSRAQWSLFLLATPVMFYSAGDFHRRGWTKIVSLWKRGSKTPVWKRFTRFGSMNLLVSSGVSVAYFSSIDLLALAASQPASPNGKGDTSTYFDSVVFLTMFLLVGKYLEAYSKSHTADAITSLGKLRPAEAYLLNGLYIESPGFRIQKTSVDHLEIGDVVRVQKGSSPPTDGTVVSGESSFDESSLTGEARLIKKKVGDKVFLGTINDSRALDVRVDAIGGETMLDHIVRLVRDGQNKRAPIERLADILTGHFVPVITLLAILTWLIWLSLGLSGALPRNYLDKDVGGWPIWSLQFAIAVFVVACPCGIGLAAPTALLVGSGLAAKLGILPRGGGEAFQEAAQLDVVVFDKTGTLTEGGKPCVTDVEVYQDAFLTREVILGIAAEVESASTHPLAAAIRSYCAEKGALISGTAFEEISGRGMKARFETPQCEVILGSEQWMLDNGVAIGPDTTPCSESWKMQGKTVVFLAICDEPPPEFQVAAVFAIADVIRHNAKSVISRLQARGIVTWMISGDHLTTAKAVARLVGIPQDKVIAGALPHEKAQHIRRLQATPAFRKRLNERSIVAMVGDGINDAPALASADVSIAIGSGSDVAISTASFILVSSDLYGVLTLIDLSRTIFRRVKFNFFWAIMYNLAALPIAAGVLYPAGHVRLDPVWGSLAMALSSISVICSSLALKFYRPPNA
ncbi:Cu-transporting P-type ATPase, partial [Laccaria bicolor S238N-H82]